MRDFDGQDSAGIEHIRKNFLQISDLYGFEYVDPSPLETLSTLETRSGPAIRDEIYHFEDKGGRQVALRFDFTMGLARRASSQRSVKLPSKVSGFGGVFRYDEPQKGRYRYFHQWDLEIFGKPTVEADAEIIEMTSALFESLGLQDVSIRISHRRLVESKIKDVFGSNISDVVISKVLRAVDKTAKKSRDEIIAEYAQNDAADNDKTRCDEKDTGSSGTASNCSGGKDDGLCAIESGPLGKMLDFAAIRGSIRHVKSVVETVGDLDGWAHIESLFDSLESRGVRNAIVDLGIVRGLDYYSGMVFEVFDGAFEGRNGASGAGMSADDNNSGGIGALAGGGRYDALTAAFGREDLGAAGVAGGVERTLLAMRDRGLMPELFGMAQQQQQQQLQKTIAVLSAADSAQGAAARVAALLRRNGIAAESDLAGRNLKRQLAYASQRGAYAAIILGPRELKNNSASLHIMDTKQDSIINLDDLKSDPRRILGISQETPLSSSLSLDPL